MKRTLILLMILLCLILAGCGKTAESTATVTVLEPTAAPTPEPTPEPVISVGGKDVKVSELEKGYTFDLFGQEVNTLTTTELSYVKQEEIGDKGLEQFRTVLPYMYGLERLSFDRCGTTDEAVSALRDEFPEIEIVWRVFFGPFTQMSDAKTIWASCDLQTNEQAEPLKYFRDLVNLDVGHCGFTDCSFLNYMPNLRVLILACNPNLEDITPVGNCTHLEYLEVCETAVADLTPLANCTELEHLNIGMNQKLTDLSPLYGLKNLKRLYMANLYTSALDMEKEQEKFEELLPDADIYSLWPGLGTALNIGQWKRTRGDAGQMVPRYEELYNTFGYGDQENDRRFYTWMLDQ